MAQSNPTQRGAGTAPPAGAGAALGSEALTNGVRVRVEPRYLPEHSGDSEAWQGRRYVFGYHVRIANERPTPARLLSRHWIILDADGERHDVRGEGVVGQQPLLAPGEVFEYSSYCPLRTPWGTMEGAYRMEGEGGEPFDVTIARFYLAARGESEG